MGFKDYNKCDHSIAEILGYNSDKYTRLEGCIDCGIRRIINIANGKNTAIYENDDRYNDYIIDIEYID